jgi:hypothetical protein
MNLLNRYLQAVGRLLPMARRKDIIAELRANILSQMEDREQELGRPLTEDEQAAILKHHGNPTVIAGRYRDTNSLGLAFGVQIIGPALFPIYRTVLLMNLAIMAVVIAVTVPIVLHATGEPVSLTRFLLPPAIQVTVTTLIFAMIDRYKGKVLDNWNPQKLPPVKADAAEGPTAKNIFEFLVVGTAWMALTPRWPYLMLGPGAAFVPAVGLKFFPLWPWFYWAIIGLLSAGVVRSFFVVFLRLPRRKAATIDLGLRGFAILISALLLLSGPNYVTLQNKEITDWANRTFETSVACVLLIHIWLAAVQMRSLLRERDQMLPARQY